MKSSEEHEERPDIVLHSVLARDTTCGSPTLEDVLLTSRQSAPGLCQTRDAHHRAGFALQSWNSYNVRQFSSNMGSVYLLVTSTH